MESLLLLVVTIHTTRGGVKTDYFLLRKSRLYLSCLWTSARFRGKEIMGDLISYMVSSSEIKQGKVTLCVRVNNTSAIRCYEKNGFKIVKRRRFIHIKWPLDFPVYTV